MPPVFETAPATSAIPITFATKTTWNAISAGLSAQCGDGLAAAPPPPDCAITREGRAMASSGLRKLRRFAEIALLPVALEQFRRQGLLLDGKYERVD